MERHNAELELQLATPLHNRLCKSRHNILEAYGYICSLCSCRADAANTGTRTSVYNLVLAQVKQSHFKG